MSSRFCFYFSFILVPLALSGCKGKPPPEVVITKAMRSEAAHLVSEAEFAMQLRDYARAEPLLLKVVEILPDEGAHWVMLGGIRRRLDNIGGARIAYHQALGAFARAYQKEPSRGDLLLQQVYVQALLGDTARAKTLLEKAGKDHPTDRQVQNFIQTRVLEQLLTDRAFREVAL